MNILEKIEDLQLREYILLNRYEIEKDIARNRLLFKILFYNWDEIQKRVKKYLKRRYHDK